MAAEKIKKEVSKMKKIIFLAMILFIMCNVTSYAEDASNKFPTAFSCVIEEEFIKDGISKEKHEFDFYQIDNMLRYDAFGIAYILDDNKKVAYNLYIGVDIYSANKIKSAVDVLNHFGISFINPQYNKVEDTGKTEVIEGYDCKIVEIVNKDVTMHIWQAPALGNLGLKYKKDDNKSTIIVKTVKKLNVGFNDLAVFDLPDDGKANRTNVK
jgi:hypothetical protein